MIKDYSRQIPKLSPRLRMVADMVPFCERVIDIGTDHAFVPIYLIAKERCALAIASDINKGPAMAAGRNIEQYLMEDRITVTVGDGLDEIRTTPQDCVVIAGMGGYEIQSILMQGPVNAKAVILQPQKSWRELRTFLSQAGYEIRKEEIAKEQERFYIGIFAVYTGIPYNLSLLEAEIGPSILADRPDYFTEYIGHRIRKMRKQVLGDPAIREVLNQLESMQRENMETKER